jgi:hypothetical protein
MKDFSLHIRDIALELFPVVANEQYNLVFEEIINAKKK